MNRSTLVKIGVATAAFAVAKAAYSAYATREGEREPADLGGRESGASSAGKPADAFSTDAIQHDLSIGEAE